MKGMTIMYDYRGKILGIVISALGLIAMIVERLRGLQFIRNWSPEQHYYFFVWVMLLGLLTIAFSREKVDDERAVAVRLKSTQLAFMMILSVTMSIGLLQELNSARDFSLRGADLLFIGAISILIYLITFHIGLYRDSVWEYENRGLVYNLKHLPKNIWGMLAYLLVVIVAILLTSQILWT